MQEIINEMGKVQIEVVPQYVTGKNWNTSENEIWEVKFGQVSVSDVPRLHERSNNDYEMMFPHESRIRNLTYSTEIFADIVFSHKELDTVYQDNPHTGQREKKVKRIIREYNHPKVRIGKVPVMLRSRFCQLKKFNEMQRVKNGKDCSFDQGGYFVINGSEKVIVAQERMANNQVNVFHKKPPSKFAWVAEIRSQADLSNRPP